MFCQWIGTSAENKSSWVIAIEQSPFFTTIHQPLSCFPVSHLPQKRDAKLKEYNCHFYDVFLEGILGFPLKNWKWTFLPWRINYGGTSIWKTSTKTKKKSKSQWEILENENSIKFSLYNRKFRKENCGKIKESTVF